jgi:acyl-CoA thioesterase II
MAHFAAYAILTSMSDTPVAEPQTSQQAVEMLLKLLDVERVQAGLWRGMRKPGGVGRVFGGQVIAQALMAATREAPQNKDAHSLHAYFLRGGDEDFPIDFRVESDFDGASFANRRVVAQQKGLPILNLVASFQRREQGLTHQVKMPDVPPPEELMTLADHARAHSERLPSQLLVMMTRPQPLETRSVGLPMFIQNVPAEPQAHLWMRTAMPVDVPDAMHRAILAYASDFGLLGTAMLPHGTLRQNAKFQTASLDHAIWFHEPFRADEWLLYTMDSPWSGHSRGFNRGMFFSREGRLVASVSQEGLIRLRP